MAEATDRAVFLSYASQDAEAAKRICEALRAAGIEVWFDRNELVGGDAWDQKIRRQIKECALFVPVISANTQVRGEGYFRLEWKLAVDRSHLMAHDQPFLLPVAIDATSDVSARVPVEFRAVQWTRLPSGETPPAFCAQVKKLLPRGVAQASPPAPHPDAGGTPALRPDDPPGRRPARSRVFAAVIALASAVGLALAFWQTRTVPRGEAAATTGKSPAASTGDKTVAVLPFRNLSGDKEQEYFSDGLTEEILNALRRERDLQVPGNASCFSFKGKGASEDEIARTLKVSRLIVGSVQRSGNAVRIRLTLWRASDGFSESLGDFDKDIAEHSHPTAIAELSGESGSVD